MILRRDLPYRMKVAQTIHAAGESSPGGLPDGTYAIALEVADEAALRHEAERLCARGFRRLAPAVAPPAPPRSLWARLGHVLCQAVRTIGRALRPPRSEPLAFVPIYEPDPPYDGALMAIGLVPARREVLRRHVSSIPSVK